MALTSSRAHHPSLGAHQREKVARQAAGGEDSAFGGLPVTHANVAGVPGVPIGFPFELDDGQLDQAIAEMLQPANWPGFDDFAKLGPELKIALLGAGLRERQQREQAEAAARALRVAYATLAASVVALVIALITTLAA